MKVSQKTGLKSAKFVISDSLFTYSHDLLSVFNGNFY